MRCFGSFQSTSSRLSKCGSGGSDPRLEAGDWLRILGRGSYYGGSLHDHQSSELMPQATSHLRALFLHVASATEGDVTKSRTINGQVRVIACDYFGLFRNISICKWNGTYVGMASGYIHDLVVIKRHAVVAELLFERSDDAFTLP